MRNLKRALSLTLASVMLLGMMVVGSSAAGFPDVEDSHNVEAIEVLQAVDVMVGDDKGNFGPDQQVSRAQMAVVMAKLLNLDYNYYQGQNPFKDVPNWAAPYVAACYANGIVSGYNSETYGANDNVTAVQAASMMMRALGYFQYKEDYNGGFELATVKQASEIGMFSQVNADAKTPLTRNQVAQMALNALRTNMVTFTGTPGIEVNGVIIGYKAGYTERTSPEAKYNAITGLTTDLATNNQYYIQLGEQLYDGKLKLNNSDLDVFQRPARTWEFNGKQIGTYVKKDLLKQSYSDKVTGGDLYDLLTKNTIDTYGFVISVDGEVEKSILNPNNTTDYGYFTTADMYRANKDAVGKTGKGVTTEVYVDTVNKEVYISVINTYLAKAEEDYDSKNDDVDLKVFKITETASKSGIYMKAADDEIIKVEGEDFDIKDVKDGDKFLVTVADGEIQTMAVPEIISEATISAFKKDKWVNADGTQYDHASTARYDQEVLEQYDDVNMKEVTFNVILDQYGYLIGLEQNQDPDQYVFLTGIDTNYSQLSIRNADANIIHMDGTMETVTVNTKDSKFAKSGDPGYFGSTPSQANTWCTFTVSDSGVYTLKQVAVSSAATAIDVPNKIKVAQYAQDVTSGTVQIDQKHVSLKGADSAYMVYGNDETVYLNVDKANIKVNSVPGDWKTIIDDVESVNTGVKNVKIAVTELGTNWTDADGNTGDCPAAEIYPLYKDNGYIIAVVTIGDNEGVASNYAYVTSSDVDWEEYGHKTAAKAPEGKWQWTREVVINGELTKLTEVGDHLKNIGPYNSTYDTGMKQGEWYEVKFDADGNVRKAEQITFTNANDKFVDRVVDVEKATEKFDTVLLSDTTTIEKLTWSSSNRGTLYTDNAQTRGFSVSPSVKVVLCLADKNAWKGQFDSKDDDYVGYAGVEKALRDMNAIATYSVLSGDGNTREVEVSAILENGIATSIVINDKVAPKSNKPSENKPGELPGAFWSSSDNAIVIPYYKTVPTSAEVRAALEPLIGTIKSLSLLGSGMAVTEDGIMYPIKLQEYIAVKIDGTPKIYTRVGTTNGDITGLVNGDTYLNGVKYKATADCTVAGGKITVGGTAVSQTDVELYTAYSVTLQNSVTASDGTNTITTGQFVATGTEVTFTGNLTSGRRSFVVDGKTYGSVATGSDKATMTLKVSGNVTVGEAASYQVTILGTNYGEVADGAKIEFSTSAPVAGLVSKKGTTLAAVDSITGTSTTKEYTVDAAGDAHTDGTITIVEAYKVATQTESAIAVFGYSQAANGDVTDEITEGTTYVEVGDTVYVVGTADQKVIVNPDATASHVTGLTVTDTGKKTTTGTKFVSSFTMPNHEVGASALCYDKYQILAQTNSNSSGVKFATTKTNADDGGTPDITAATTWVEIGTTVYIGSGADNKAITAGSLTLTEEQGKAADKWSVYSFTMPVGTVAANEFTREA